MVSCQTNRFRGFPLLGWGQGFIKYPAFRSPLAPVLWDAFLETYGREELPSEKRFKLYMMMQNIDAASGNYLEPAAPGNEKWKKQAWKGFYDLVDEVEKLV